MANPKIFDISRAPIIVPVVTPPGPGQTAMVKNFKIQSNCPPWLEIIQEAEGTKPAVYGVRGAYARVGYRLLEDHYREEEAVKADLRRSNKPEDKAAAAKLQGADGWKRYQQYLDDWQAGRTQNSFPQRLLPKTVREAIEGKRGDGKPDPWAEDKTEEAEAVEVAEDKEPKRK